MVKLMAFVKQDTSRALNRIVQHAEINRAHLDRLHDEARREDTLRAGLANRLNKLIKQGMKGWGVGR